MLTNLMAAFSALYIVLPIVGLIVGGALGVVVYMMIQKRKNDKAKETANQIVEEALNQAKNLRKEAVLESKEEILKQRTEFDKEIRDRQNEVRRQEQRIVQREETLDKKESALDKKMEALDEAKADLKTQLDDAKAILKAQQDEVEAIKQKENEALKRVEEQIQKVAQMSKEDAAKMLIASIEDEAKKDAARLVRDIEAQARDEGDRKAKDIISNAVQKCAVDHSSDITVSVVPLPNEDMKGRIIGREGRNIRALENATGVDLIIDDTPEAVVLSGFDPIRREVARLSLEKLIEDGRIHPGRIEEVVEKVRKELDQQIKEAGESAAYETGVFNLHSDIIRLLGRLKYRTSYGQNVLKHSIEVAHLAGLLATEVGADVNLCKRAGLLHDIGKSVDHEVEGTHITIGADIAKKYKENKDIIHCIAAHHNDIEPQTIEAVLVQCADAISGARPGARRESLENYVKRLEKLEVIANSHEGVEKSYAIQAGREIRIMVKPEIVDDAATLFLAKDIARQIEKEMDYPGQIKVSVIRETRSTDYAK